MWSSQASRLDSIDTKPLEKTLMFRSAQKFFVLATLASLLSVTGTAHNSSAQQVQSPSDNIYTQKQASRGEKTYNQYCVACHGTDLLGTDFGPGVDGNALMARWNQRTLMEFYELIRTTMPVNSPGGLSPKQYVDLVAFLLQEAGFPSGQIELSQNTDQLAQIKFSSGKP